MGKLIHCTGLGCESCGIAVKVGESFLGDAKYTCVSNPKKHREISVLDCNAFVCANKGEYFICATCEAG